MARTVLAVLVLAAAAAIVFALLRLVRGGRSGPADGGALAPSGDARAGAAARPRAGAGGYDVPKVLQAVDAPVAWPGGTGGALPRALASATYALWRRAFGVTEGALRVPPGNEFAAESLERTLAGDGLGERWFPRRPMLMPQLQAAANDPDSPPTRLASIIAQDPVLAGDVLRLANSVFYRLSPEPVESLQRAVVVCGTDGLQSLAATALVQPVFRASSHSHARFAQLLWERCTRAAAAAEACARQWTPQDRQTAQLLPLLAALGPLVAYRLAEEAYRSVARSPSPEACLSLVLRHGPRLAARVAAQWQMPARLVQVLSGELPQAGPEATALDALVRSWQAGELLATLTLLADEHLLDAGDYTRQAAQAGVPEPVASAFWARSQSGRAPTSQAAPV